MIKLFKIQLLLFIIIVSFTGCAALKVVKLVNSGEVVPSDYPESVIPFETRGHAIFIKARLNNSQKEYNFIFDTGALTAISKQVAKELELQDGIEVVGSGTGGKSETVELMKLDNIIVGNTKVKDCAAAVVDFSKQFSLDISGILGSNFFRHFQVTIDYQNKEITFSHDTKPIAINKSNEIKIPFKTDIKYGFAPKIECEVNGEIKGAGIIDTGSPGLADLPLSMMKKTKSFQEGAVLTSNGSMSGGMFGMTDKSYLTRVDELKIGDLRLSNIPSMSHSAKGENILFGNRFLSKFLVILNYPAGEMVLKPYGTDFETNIPSYGLGLVKKEEKTVVSGIWDNSSAAGSSMKPGDEIVMVNSKDANVLSLFELMVLFMDENINDIEVEFLNDKGKYKAKLHKEMLLPALK